MSTRNPITRMWRCSPLHSRASWLGSVALGLLAMSACSRDAAQGRSEAAVKQRTFATAEAAADAIIQAAGKFDQPALVEILGSEGKSLVVSKDTVSDRTRALAFAKLAGEQHRIDLDSSGTTATLTVGKSDWPLPIPIVKEDSTWRFDAEAGAREVLLRRIGDNELDAIQVCHGFVEAQRQYAQTRHDGSLLNQYAQRIISTPGKQDGLAWRAADGSWQGPVGERIAEVIAEGYSDRIEPFHGYYYKVLKGQGPAAPMGQIDYLVKGVMIGGFALVAAPADYLVTGVKTFMVSNDGTVYEKDLGPQTLEQFRAMEQYNPDSTWTPVNSN